MRAFALALAALLLAATPAFAQHIDTNTCDSVAGWMLTNFQGGQPAGATMAVVEGSVAVHYQRHVVTALYNSAVLTELREMRFSIFSARQIQLAFVVEDRDKARFIKIIELAGNQWNDVRVRAEELTLTDDSPTRKNRLEPERLGMGYALVDMGALQGQSGENLLRFDTITLETTSLTETAGEWEISGLEVVNRSAIRTGKIIVKRNGHLKVTAPRFIVDGSIVNEGGTVEITGGVVAVRQAFPQQNNLLSTAGAKWRLRDALVVNWQPMLVHLFDRSSFTAQNTRFVGGMSCVVREKCEVSLTDVLEPGEFFVAIDATFNAVNTEKFRLYLQLGSNFKDAELVLPAGAEVANWSAGHGLNVRLRGCKQVHWGILSAPNADGTVTRSELGAISVLLAGDRQTDLRGLQPRRTLRNHRLDVWDRALIFTNTNVGGWQFIVDDSARLRLETTAFGSLWARKNASVEIRDCVCEGNIGHLDAAEQSEIRLIGCKIYSAVVARDQAKIIFENCEIAGPVRATGSATIEFRNCKFTGRVENDPGAKLVIQPGPGQ